MPFIVVSQDKQVLDINLIFDILLFKSGMLYCIELDIPMISGNEFIFQNISQFFLLFFKHVILILVWYDRYLITFRIS